MANKLGIPIDDKPILQAEKIEIKAPINEQVTKPIEKVIKVESKPYTPRKNEPKVIPKKHFYGQKPI